MFRQLPAAAFAGSVLFLPALASAQTAGQAPPPSVVAGKATSGGDDEVKLKDGSALRGTVVAVDPDKEVVILVGGNGEGRHVPWAEVERVNQGKYAKKADADAPPLDAPHTRRGAPPSRRAPRGWAPPRIHIEADRPGVTLYERTDDFDSTDSSWMPPVARLGLVQIKSWCVAPCDRAIDGGAGPYFFGGDGIRNSQYFSLAGMSGDVSVNVHAGSSGRRVGGAVVVALGVVAVLGGTTTVILGIGGHSGQTTAIGGITAGTGAGALAGGLVMLGGTTTTYQFTNATVSSLATTGVLHF